MSHHWYWQNRGTVYGPLSTDELEDLVRRNRVFDDDSIRLDGTDDWIPALEIKALFTESLEGDAGDTAAQSAAHALSHRNRLRLSQEADETQTGAALGSFLAKALRGIGSLGSALEMLASRALTPVTTLMSRLRRPVILSIITASLLAVMLFRLLSGVELRDTKTDDAQLSLSETWEEFQEMKQRRASPAEWKSFEEETIAWLKPMLTTLGETATANQASSLSWGRSGFDKGLAQQQLVSAGWILRDLIVDARMNSAQPEGKSGATSGPGKRTNRLMTFPTDPPEVQFSKRMATAKAYLEGTAETLRPAHVKPPEPEPGNWWTAGLLSVSGCVLVGGGVGWWWKRRH